MTQKKIVAVSACLLGQRVRYDGKHQENSIVKSLAEYFDLLAVCPEVEIGLAVPRDKVSLHLQGNSVRMLTSATPVLDLTNKMQDYARSFVAKYPLSGFILKDKSPSCGVKNCKQWQGDIEQDSLGSGIFAASIMSLCPELPMIQSHLIEQKQELNCFIDKVNSYEC